MKNTNLEGKYSFVEGGGRNLKNIAITTALWATLLALPIACTKCIWQKNMKRMSQVEKWAITGNNLVENFGGNWEMTAVCDWTYVYHGHHYFE